MLIRAAELLPRLATPDVVVFDCRHDLLDHAKGAQAYAAGHVPGAHFAPVETALSGPKTGRNGRHPLPAPEVFAAFLQRHGVTPATTVVAYDDAGGLYAARLWWMTRWIGHARVALLDGGLPKWIADGHPVTRDIPTAVPAAAPLPVAVRDGDVVTVDEILARLGDPSAAVLDARAAERYRGDTETIDPVAGHIPGALNRFYKANLNADLTFRDPAALRAEFSALFAGRDPAQVAHSCGSGITACANLFAMDYAGLPGSKLYAGSWSEWVADPARPVARGAN
jgi:thiosulfate/3-mercaptopyruvate sulfurtransferase